MRLLFLVLLAVLGAGIREQMPEQVVNGPALPTLAFLLSNPSPLARANDRYNYSTTELSRTFECKRAFVYAIAFSPDGLNLASNSSIDMVE